jgi:hypothetical protein
MYIVYCSIIYNMLCHAIWDMYAIIGLSNVDDDVDDDDDDDDDDIHDRI